MNECLQKLTCHHRWLEESDQLRLDFRNFVHFAFTHILNFEVSGLQFDIADYMQNLPLSEDGKARGQIQSLRGVGKTVLVGLFIVWLLYCNPDIKIAVICSTQPFSRRMIAFVRGLLDSHDLFRHLVPKKAEKNNWSDFRKDMPDHADGFLCGDITVKSTEDSIKGFAVLGTFTGAHPNVIISDDVETPENSLSELKRERLHEKVKEFEDLVVPGRDGGAMIMFLGTPQTEQSIYFEKLDARYCIRRWPARYPDPNESAQMQNLAPKLAEDLKCGRCKPGDPTHPERHGEDELLVKEAIEGIQRFALQYMLDPTLADADRYPLKLTNLVVFDAANDMAPDRVVWGSTKPCDYISSCGLQGDKFYEAVWASDDYLPYQMSVLYIDPKGRGGDTVGWCVAKALNGYAFVPACGGFAGKKGMDGASDRVLEKLAQVALIHGVKRIVVESNFGDGMYTKLLAPVVARICGPVEIVEVNSTGQKEKRIIDVLKPLTQMKRLVVGTDVAKNEDLWMQYTRITELKGCLKHDDLVEALAGACTAVSDVMQLDPEKASEKRKADEKKKMALEFQQSVLRGVSADGKRQVHCGRMPTVDEQIAERDRQSSMQQRRGSWGGAGRRGTRGWGGA